MALELRPVEEADVGRLLAILRRPEVAQWWGDYDESKLREELFDDARVTCFAVAHDGLTVGMVEVTEETDPDYRCVELDVFLDPDCHGRGLGAEALRVALRRYFERGHHRAIIIPAAANEVAIRCYAKVGFKPVGILRRADRGRDSLVMDLLTEELT